MVLLIHTQAHEKDEEGFPLRPSRNVFHRLIRDPTHPERPARERKCTELLRAVLIHCPTVRAGLMVWMAEQAELDLPAETAEELHWNICTEAPAGGKRLDLVIEAFPEGSWEEGAPFSLLWAVEVKVQSGFHDAPPYDEELQQTKTESSQDPAPVHQVANYDLWLSRREADRTAGFVLGLKNLTKKLPSQLQERWTALTWSGLGEQLKEILSEESLTGTEVFLGRQMLEFIRLHLWRENEVTEQELTFDDVALIRAMSLHAEECRDKVKEISSTIEQVMEEANIKGKQIDTQRTLFAGDIKQWVRLYLTSDKDILLEAGVHFTDLALALWCKPNCSAYSVVEQIVDSAIDQLKDLDPSWTTYHEEGASQWSSEWRPVEIRLPLQDLLAAEDQQLMVRTFVRGALEDLQESSILPAIQSEFQDDTSESPSK